MFISWIGIPEASSARFTSCLSASVSPRPARRAAPIRPGDEPDDEVVRSCGLQKRGQLGGGRDAGFIGNRMRSLADGDPLRRLGVVVAREHDALDRAADSPLEGLRHGGGSLARAYDDDAPGVRQVPEEGCQAFGGCTAATAAL